MDGDSGALTNQDKASETGSRTLLRVYLASGRVDDAARELASLHIVEGVSVEDERLVASLLEQAGQSRLLEERSARVLQQPSTPPSVRGLALFHYERLNRHRTGYSISIERVQAFLGSSDASSVETYVRACLHMLMGGCWRRLRRFEDARRELESSLRLFESSGEFEQVGDCLIVIGSCAKASRDWDEAEVLHSEAVRHCERYGLTRKLVVAMVNLGVLRLFRGHFEIATSALRRARLLAEEIGDEIRRMAAIRDHGLTSARSGNLRGARMDLGLALDLTRRCGTPRHKALIHEYLGELALHEGRLPAARRWLRRGYELARRIPELDIMGETRCRLAEVELRGGNLDLARSIIDECLADFIKMEDLYEVAVCRRVLGEVLRAQGQEQEALEAWALAQEFFDTIGERYELAKVVRLSSEESGMRTEPSTSRADADSPSTDAANSTLKRRGRPLVRWSGTSHPDFPEIIGAHPVLLAMLDRAKQYARSDAPILLEGETGTGKELVAAALHRLGSNPSGVYLPYNCGAGSSELIDAELFGHTRGSFTGATADRPGLIRSARNGTLFLDEIGELEENLQTHLLRFLDRGEIRVVGSDRPEHVLVRVIAATHRDLERQVGDGKFRSDLLHRFSLRLSIPPLRERRDDVPLLVDHFVRQVRLEKHEFGGLSDGVIAKMREHSWPGNVRELRNAVLDLALRSRPGQLADDWSPRMELSASRESPPELSREVLIAELERSGGLVRAACSRLGISHQRFYRRCRELGIDLGAYRG